MIMCYKSIKGKETKFKKLSISYKLYSLIIKKCSLNCAKNVYNFVQKASLKMCKKLNCAIMILLYSDIKIYILKTIYSTSQVFIYLKVLYIFKGDLLLKAILHLKAKQ